MKEQITERGILFSSEMVRAILDGRKTETRRVVMPQPVETDKSLGCPCFGTPRYGMVGDILYVRETFMILYSEIYYKADTESIDPVGHRWKPSIHMPKKFSRIKLKIKEIRVEKLQEMNNEDAVNEGICDVWGLNARCQYISLWDSLNKKRGFGWDVNPWVWVIKFERIK